MTTIVLKRFLAAFGSGKKRRYVCGELRSYESINYTSAPDEAFQFTSLEHAVNKLGGHSETAFAVPVEITIEIGKAVSMRAEFCRQFEDHDP